MNAPDDARLDRFVELLLKGAVDRFVRGNDEILQLFAPFVEGTSCLFSNRLRHMLDTFISASLVSTLGPTALLLLVREIRGLELDCAFPGQPLNHPKDCLTLIGDEHGIWWIVLSGMHQLTQRRDGSGRN